MKRFALISLIWLGLTNPVTLFADGPETAVKPTSLTTVYADGRHNMNAAIAQWKDRYWIAFRTGEKHSSPDGAEIVLSSPDGKTWEKVHTVDSPLDDRDVMLISTPERLLLFVPHVEKSPEKGIVANETVITTTDGKAWTDPLPVYQPNFAFWRPVAHQGKFWATAYRPGSYGSRILDLIHSEDGITWEKVTTMRKGHAESETTLLFVSGGKLLAFHRDGGKKSAGFLMTSRAPYTEWTEPVQLPTMLNGQSAYTFNGVHYLLTRTIRRDGDTDQLGTMIYTVDDNGQIMPYCKLLASGDCAYPTAIQVNEEMWVGYHSSHEGTANIYLAKVPLKSK